MSSHTKGKNELTEMFLEKMNILNRRFLDVIEDAVRRLPCCDLAPSVVPNIIDIRSSSHTLVIANCESPTEKKSLLHINLRPKKLLEKMSPTIKDYLKYVEQLDQIYGSKNIEMDEKIEKKSENIEMIEMEEEIFSHKKDELKKIGELKKTEHVDVPFPDLPTEKPKSYVPAQKKFGLDFFADLNKPQKLALFRSDLSKNMDEESTSQVTQVLSSTFGNGQASTYISDKVSQISALPQISTASLVATAPPLPALTQIATAPQISMPEIWTTSQISIPQQTTMLQQISAGQSIFTGSTTERQAIEDAEYQPPKPEDVAFEEPDAVFSTKCSCFMLKDDVYKKFGVGYMFIKKRVDKRILLVRMATSTGNILLNALIDSSMKCSRLAENKLRITCVSDNALGTYLFRFVDNASSKFVEDEISRTC
ncbi:unnamed protein product [Dracunculus medinensis]|uniref:RanBD1 domain-containing protein n=1 Tax=Dracunculus medinensis TaxID=318479 RepID=A0A158Q464_DRAME|nr:unnamed protein product [Dracunculus medinensis]